MARFQISTDPGSVFYGQLLDQFTIFTVDDDEPQISKTWRPLDDAAVRLLVAKGVKGAQVQEPLVRGKGQGPKGAKPTRSGMATLDDGEPVVGGFAARPRVTGSSPEEALSQVRAKVQGKGGRPSDTLG